MPRGVYSRKKSEDKKATSLLKSCLQRIAEAEAESNYDERNQFTFFALGAAKQLGYEHGFKIDPQEPEWPVAYIDLPTGQVSWHTPGYVKEWDGHTTEEKYERISQYLQSVA